MRLIALIDLPESNRGFLTCHVLDTSGGCPAAKMRIELYRMSDGQSTLIQSFLTNEDGRLCGGPALKGNDFEVGTYQWIFYVGDYFSSKTIQTAGCPFLTNVPIQFGIDDPEAHYHVPLLVSPYGYSTYRGS